MNKYETITLEEVHQRNGEKYILRAILRQNYESRGRFNLFLSVREANPTRREYICAVTKETKVKYFDNMRACDADAFYTRDSGYRFQFATKEEGVDYVKQNTGRFFKDSINWEYYT